MGMLSKLSDSASVWIFQSNQKLKVDQLNYINESLGKFVPEWSAHGVNLKSDFQIVDDLCIVIGVDEGHAGASGCSKDALTRHIKEIGEAIDIDFFDRLRIAYLNEKEEITLVNMLEFKAGVQADVIRRDTIVYNNLIETKRDLSLNWKIKVADSWHANLVMIQ